MDSSGLQHALQLHFTPAMYALTQRQNSARPFHSTTWSLQGTPSPAARSLTSKSD